MRTVLVCSAGFGEGHHTAARSLCAAFDELGAAQGVRAEFVDILAERHPRLNKLLTRGYVQVLNRAPHLWASFYRTIDGVRGVGAPPAALATLRAAIVELLERTRPAAVVSTYPVYGYVLDDIAQRGGPSAFLRVTVITDSISVNAVWLRAGCHFYVVANEETAAVLRARGVAAEDIRVLGFPVHPRFVELRERIPRPDSADPQPGQGRRVLYLINAGKRNAPALVRRLLKEIDGLSLTVATGRDERLRAAVERIVAEAGPACAARTRVIGWTKEMPELLCAHHLLISKAGGATVQETIAAGCPMLMSQVAPGQEEGNARLLLEGDAGALALTPKATVAAVRAAFADHAALCRRWMQNIARLSRPDAARDIARFVLSQMGSGN